MSKAKQFDSVWDAIEDTPQQAASMRARRVTADTAKLGQSERQNQGECRTALGDHTTANIRPDAWKDRPLPAASADRHGQHCGSCAAHQTEKTEIIVRTTRNRAGYDLMPGDDCQRMKIRFPLDTSCFLVRTSVQDPNGKLGKKPRDLPPVHQANPLGTRASKARSATGTRRHCDTRQLDAEPHRRG